MSERGLVRTGTVTDVPLLAAIELAAGRLFPASRIPDPDHTYPVAELIRAADEGLLFVVEVDGAVVGFATCSRSGERLHLDEVSVHPDQGRRGYGRALVLRVIEEARERKQVGVSLTTFSDIAWNGPFYTAMGFLEMPESEQDATLREALAGERAFGMTNRIAMVFVIDAQAGNE